MWPAIQRIRLPLGAPAEPLLLLLLLSMTRSCCIMLWRVVLMVRRSTGPSRLLKHFTP